MANLQCPSRWFYFGIIAIILGFVFLRIPPADGFFTMNIAPLFLVIGFLIFVPLGLYPSIKMDNSSEFKIKVLEERVYINTFGFVVFVTVWMIYINTMWPAPAWWGSAEYINGAYNLNIQSPPGSVILQIVGRLFSFLWFIENPALRINFMIATLSASAVTILYFTIIRILKQIITGYKSILLIIIPSILASISFAFTESVWNKATFTNPYALSLLTASLLIYLAVRWWEYADQTGAGNILLLSAFLFGLDLSVHRSNLLLTPAFFFMVLIRRPKTLLDFRIWIGGLALLFFGFSLQLFNLFRAQLNPPVNFNDPGTWQGLWDYLTLAQYNIKTFGSDLLQRKGPFWETQIKHEYLRYLGWNYIGMDSQGENIKWSGMFGIPLLIGLLGLVYHFIKKSKHALFVFGLFFMASMGAVIYLNVPENFFRPMDRHYLPSFMIFAVWIGLGCYSVLILINWLAKSYKTAFIIGVLILSILLPFNMLYANWTNNDQSQNYSAYSYGYNLLQSCDENAILVCAGDNDTFLCWYLQQVEKIRPDMITINWWLMTTPWYPVTIKSNHPDSPFDIEYDSSMNNVLPWNGDTVIIVGATDTLTYWLKPTFRDQYLLPNDLRFLEVLKKNRWERPVYFSTGFGNNIPLGLNDYCQLSGLAYYLQVSRADSVKVEYDKLEQIVFEKFIYKGFGKNRALDRVGRNIINNYFKLYMDMASHYKMTGNEEKVDNLMKKIETYFPDLTDQFKKYMESTER